MALPTNTFATYQAVGNREDLSDTIYRIDFDRDAVPERIDRREGDGSQSRMANPGAGVCRHHQCTRIDAGTQIAFT
jgi:hypothetical protein